MNKVERYIDKVNEILSNLDFVRLEKSCNGTDKSYAKDTLSKLHNEFVSIYGDSPLGRDDEFVAVPCVIRNRQTGYTLLGIVDIDLSASGEHYGTDFFTPFGVLSHGMKEKNKAEEDYLHDKIGIYDYWYTPSVEHDIHVDFENVPQGVVDILSSCSVNCCLSELDSDEIKM